MNIQEFINFVRDFDFDSNLTYVREFYIEKKIDLKEFERILIKSDFDKYLGLILLYFYKLENTPNRLLKLKEIIENQKKHRIEDYPKQHKKAQILKLLRETHYDKIDIKITSPINSITIKDYEILNVIKEFLESYFMFSKAESPSVFENIDDQMLDEYIKQKDLSKIKKNKGAPEKLTSIYKIANNLLLLMRWESDIRNINNSELEKYIIELKPKNKECRLIHDIMVFWDFVENKNTQTNTNTPSKYIRTLIFNSKKKHKQLFR